MGAPPCRTAGTGCGTEPPRRACRCVSVFGLTVPSVTPTTTTSTGTPVHEHIDEAEVPAGPPMFCDAARSLLAYRPRTEITMQPIKAPQRLAPYVFGLGAEVDGPADDAATARLILLHDPDGQESWQGVLRLVAFLRADVDAELATDPLLPEVGWSWLTDALDQAGAPYLALGGTVTRTTSARFGDIAGPEHTNDIELRASWTPTAVELGPHAEGFCSLLSSTVGLPPVGISVLRDQRKGS